MLLPDVNVLVYAHHADSPNHADFAEWLTSAINGEEVIALSDFTCSGFLRIVTNPRAFDRPSNISDALTFIEQIRGHANCVALPPGPRHWDIFAGLCQSLNLKGNLIPDAYLAALAIESGSECITTDRGFARYPALRWRRPFESRQS